MKRVRPLDTTAEAERIQIESYKRMTPEQRLQIALELTEIVRQSLAEGVRSRHPDYDEEQVHFAVIRLTLPEELFLAAYPKVAHIKP